MATIDDIFTSSNLSESKKRAKKYFGRILISLRKSNHIKIYSLLESVDNLDIIDNKMILSFRDKVSYEMLNNEGDIAILNEILQGIEQGVVVCLQNEGKEKLDVYKFTNMLKEEFGKILTIK